MWSLGPRVSSGAGAFMAETHKVPRNSKGTTTADSPLGEFIPASVPLRENNVKRPPRSQPFKGFHRSLTIAKRIPPG